MNFNKYIHIYRFGLPLQFFFTMEPLNANLRTTNERKHKHKCHVYATLSDIFPCYRGNAKSKIANRTECRLSPLRYFHHFALLCQRKAGHAPIQELQHPPACSSLNAPISKRTRTRRMRVRMSLRMPVRMRMWQQVRLTRLAGRQEHTQILNRSGLKKT